MDRGKQRLVFPASAVPVVLGALTAPVSEKPFFVVPDSRPPSDWLKAIEETLRRMDAQLDVLAGDNSWRDVPAEAPPLTDAGPERRRPSSSSRVLERGPSPRERLARAASLAAEASVVLDSPERFAQTDFWAELVPDGARVEPTPAEKREIVHRLEREIADCRLLAKRADAKRRPHQALIFRQRADDAAAEVARVRAGESGFPWGLLYDATRRSR